MKKVKNIFHKIANADPMIWGYVMLIKLKPEKQKLLVKNLINAERLFVNNQKSGYTIVQSLFSVYSRAIKTAGTCTLYIPADNVTLTINNFIYFSTYYPGSN